MTNGDTQRRPEDHRRSASFLVRLWHEPASGAEAGDPTTVRGFIRTLATGEEEYIAGPAALAAALLRRLGTGDLAANTHDNQAIQIG
jgi:hypothetical protein